MSALRYRQAVATTPGSAAALNGSFGGAVGSSQSANWKPVSHRPFGDNSVSTWSRWPVIVPNEARRSATSPYASYSAQGTQTPASLHRQVDSRGRPGRGVSNLRASGTCLLYTSPSPRDGLLS